MFFTRYFLFLLCYIPHISGQKNVISADKKFDPSAYGCAPGWEYQNSKCVFREEVPFYCHGIHYSKLGNDCVKQKNKRAEPICEPGYHSKKNRTTDKNDKRNHRLCTSKDRIDYILTCPENYNLEHHGKKCIMEMPVAPLKQECHTKKSSKMISTSSEGAYTSAGILACPLGSSYDKKTHQCIVYHSLRPQRTCRPPYVHFGQIGTGWRCQLRDRMPMAYGCSHGYHLVDDGTKMCIKYIPDDSKKHCPEGFNLMKGAGRGMLQYDFNNHKKGDIIIEDRCVRYIFDEPIDLKLISECAPPPTKLLREELVNEYDPDLELMDELFVGIFYSTDQ